MSSSGDGGNPTFHEWQARMVAEGFGFNPHSPVYLDMEVADAISKGQRYSDQYLSEMSKELKENGKAPEKFSTKTLQRARKGQTIHFGRAYTLAMILECEVRDIVVLGSLAEADDDDEASAQNGYASPEQNVNVRHRRFYTVSSIIPEISSWLRLIFAEVVLVGGFYVVGLAFGGYEWLRIAFPVAHSVGSFGVAYLARMRGKFPMPMNMRFLLSLTAGVLSGAIAFFAIARMETYRLREFDGSPLVQAAMLFFILAGIVSFLAGHRAAAARRIRPLSGGVPLRNWSIYTAAILITSSVVALGGIQMK